MKETTEKWVKQPEWFGNTKLGLDSYMKHFTRHTSKIPVYIFGCSEPIKQTYDNFEWTTHGFGYCVSAGANSQYSYSDAFPTDVKYDVQKCMDYLDELDRQGKLIY